jgi:predicted flavoprotein YhiN
MSGPAVLQISNYWEKGKPVSIDLMPDIAAAELLYAIATKRRR